MSQEEGRSNASCTRGIGTSMYGRSWARLSSPLQEEGIGGFCLLSIAPNHLQKTTMMRRALLVIAVLALCILLDQVTKQIASLYLSPLTSTVYWDGILRFIYAENSGIMFSIGAGLSENLQFWLFTLFPLASCLVLLVYVFAKQELSQLTLISCALIVGGGLSNILDRLLNDGAVVDFIYLNLWDRSTGIFNIADVAISVGIAAMIIQVLIKRGRNRHASVNE